MTVTHPQNLSPTTPGFLRRRAGMLLAVAGAGALALSGCSQAEETAAANDPGEAGFDVSAVTKVDEVASLVPADIAASGVLANGASTDYAPAEYRKVDGQTPTGYDVDLVNALAATMGLKGTTTHVEFDSLLPQIGTKFTIGVSSFTITPEREAQMTMVSYFKAGFQYATAKGNPAGFDPKDICGTTIGVQTGTAQQEWLENASKECTDAGKKAVSIKPHKAQTEVSTPVASGQYDAMLADSPVVGYVVEMSGGKIEALGDIFESALHGIAVPKDKPELAEAVRAGIQHLIDDGTYAKLLEHYGASSGAIETAEINPNVEAAQ